ncbi:tetratricopeptide repeat protein [uncultured Methanobrevibacter sp.]|uniref:tetratricopeptide repeat protein n=1 Tax=uncultured Methanobrevibacter sp. TaxID=253161 RepID=UPI00261DAF76|nr:tetratricopeptide repeat protein [uncultured Methanobrevibacter sp.]
MSDKLEQAKDLIKNEEYKKALDIAKKRHGRDKIDEYLTILDLLIQKDYLPAIEERGHYHQYYDSNHDNGDYGEKYFDMYLEIEPQSINGLCDKAMSLSNKNKLKEAIEYMDKAFKNYEVYSQKEEPRISHEEVRMGKIELLMKDNQNQKALSEINKYEKKFGENKKEIFYKGQLLERTGEYKKALEYLNKSLDEEHTIIALNSKGNALYELGKYDEALNAYNSCITHEKDAKDELDLITNFNYKAAFCNVKLGKYDEAMKYLNKTIDMLNDYGRLDKDLEAIYQKCSFEKDKLMYKDNVEDKRFGQFKFLSSKTSITALLIIIIAYIILKIIGY